MYSSEYPIQAHYIDLIKSEIVNELTRFIVTPEDKENNSSDETTQN
jgi:hypothetical protein